MIIDNEYGQFGVSLGDDGTMDTVICVEHEIRYGDTSEHRDEHTGAMTDDGFTELALDAIDAYCQQYIN